MHGEGQLAEHAADYVILYATAARRGPPIRRRHQMGAFQPALGRELLRSGRAPQAPPVRAPATSRSRPSWGWSQTRVVPADDGPWVNWLWAWENPHPEKADRGLSLRAGSRRDRDLGHLGRGRRRAPAALAAAPQGLPAACPEGEAFRPDLDEDGLLEQIQLDLGQVISATPRLVYPNEAWPESYNNQLPELAASEILVEYTAHPEACFHLAGAAGSR